jgi:tetratricopeptide (TPR) repeat protein
MEQAQRLLAAQYRLAQHYLDELRTAQRTYEQGNENEAHALALFDREREQVKQWQAWAVAHAGQDEQAMALCSKYAGASPDIFKLRLLPQEYLSWLEAALAAARRLEDRRAEVTHLLEICELSDIIMEYPHTIDYAQQALTIARQIDDQSLLAQALIMGGLAARNQGNLEEAQAYFEQSLVLYETIGDRRGMAKTLDWLATLALTRRNNVAAQNYLEQNLVLFREMGDQNGIASCLNNLGFLAIRLGNYTIASDYLEQALALCHLIGDKLSISVGLTNLGTIAYYQGEYSIARNYFEQGLAAGRSAHIREREAIGLYKLGLVTMAQGDAFKAQGYFEESLAFSRYTTTGTLLPETLSNLAIVYMLLHQENLAYAILHEALEIASNPSVAHARLLVLVAAVRVWVLKGKSVQAATWLGLVENHPHPAVKMTDIQRDVQAARTECAAALTPEQFAAAWEEGKTLNLDTVIAEILSEL